jgi:hypothetical protein
MRELPCEADTQTEEAMSVTKDTNPKDALGIKKAPMHVVSAVFQYLVGLGMMEGSRKYGSHNYRVAGVRASVYYDAARRHLDAWWEGQDIDPDSGLPHLAKAGASLAVIVDAVYNGKWEDDRPPKLKDGWMKEMNAFAAQLIERYPKSEAPYTQKQLEEFENGTDR